MGTHAPARPTRSAPLGGRITTPVFWACAAFVGLAFVLLSVRFALGLGAATAMNDGYPWGIWIAWDVVVGTALSTGGYAMALLVYVANRGRYHPLVRSALLMSALGYTLAGYSVLVDLGRWWNMWKIPVYAWHWNGRSALLEVALCVMLYTAVLWVEVAPAILERLQASRARPRLRELAARLTPPLERALPFVIALGVLLPTMHQSSLGALMILPGPRLHPLWQTPFLPLLFLLSAVAMGYASVVMETMLTGLRYRVQHETALLRGLRPAAVVCLVAFAAVRLLDLAWRGRLGDALVPDRHGVLFAAEMALALVPAAMLTWGEASPRTLFRAAALVLLGGILYRISTFLIAFHPGHGFRYFPSLGELGITFGLIAGEVGSYLVIVRRFPILAARAPRQPRPVPPPPSGLPGVPATAAAPARRAPSTTASR